MTICKTKIVYTAVAVHPFPATWRGSSESKGDRPRPIGVQETGVLQMVMDDAIVEAFESDNLTLQTMSGGKYVQV